MINEQLKEFGLSDKETMVYIILLQLGTASAQEIAKTSELNRSTTYVVLDSLLNRGLINISEQTDRRIYTAISPELLLQKTADLIKKYSKIEKDIQSIIPDLQSLSKNLKRRPRILFFEGLEGVKSVYEDILSCESGTIMRSFDDSAAWKKIKSNYYENICKKRIARGIKTKSIQPIISSADKNTLVLKNSKTKNNTSDEIIYIQNDKYSFTSNLSIYENKVILISPQDEYAVIIENEDIAQTMKELFNLAWEEAKRISKQ